MKTTLLLFGFLFTALMASSQQANAAIVCGRMFNVQYQHWQQAWNSISNENPKNDTPFFAIGIHDSLDGKRGVVRSGFLYKMTYKFRHFVFSITARGSGYERYVADGIPISVETFFFVAYNGLAYMLKWPDLVNNRSPNTKNILVTLEGIDFEHPDSNATQELIFLFNNPDLLAHSRWFVSTHELSFDEIYDFYLQLHAAFPKRVRPPPLP